MVPSLSARLLTGRRRDWRSPLVARKSTATYFSERPLRPSPACRWTGRCVSHMLTWVAILNGRIESHEKASLDLRFTKIGLLLNEEKSWPSKGNVKLDGFVYDQFDDQAPNAKVQLNWLHLQPKKPFSSPPYEQLAKVLKSSSHESEATEVLIAKQDDLRRYGDLGWWAKFAILLLGFSIRHGYKPRRALFGMLIFILFGTIAFQAGYWCHLLTRSNNLANVPIARADYPKFQAFVYSLDTFLPIVDLNQKGYWLPNANHGDNVIPGVRFRWGGLLRIYFWVHIIFGWILTTLWVAGFTGLVRRLN